LAFAVNRYRCCLMVLVLALLPAALAGCATHADYLKAVRMDYYSGHTAEAAAQIDKRLKQPTNDGDVLKLERAVVHLTSGKPHEAEKMLREVRDRFDYLEQKSLGESALRMLTDDNAAAYPGEDYEKVLIRAFLSLSNLMGDGGDALAYALQVDQKQNQIIERGTDASGKNPKLAYRQFKQVALGPYLHGALVEETHTNFDDVVRSWNKVVSWEPEFRPGRADVQRATYGAHSARGNGVLYVFAMVGRGPYKIQANEIASSVSLLIADRILTAVGKHSLPPTIAPIKVPKVVVSASNIRAVDVWADGRPCGATETITDVGRMAVQQYEAIYPEVIARAIVRRVLKKGIVYAGEELAHTQKNSLAELGFNVAGVVWEATEAADTRCWGLLPDQIQVLRLELPAGEHHIGLRPAGAYGPAAGEYPQTVSIADGRNTYLLASFPDMYMVGQMLVSQH
jgi:hypothetical protein